MLNRASIFANHNNNKKIPMKTLCLSSNVVQTDKTFENNYKTKKKLTQRQSNGEPEQEIFGKIQFIFL